MSLLSCSVTSLLSPRLAMYPLSSCLAASPLISNCHACGSSAMSQLELHSGRYTWPIRKRVERERWLIDKSGRRRGGGGAPRPPKHRALGGEGRAPPPPR